MKKSSGLVIPDQEIPAWLWETFTRNHLIWGDAQMTVGVAAAVANADLNRFRNSAAAAIAAVYVKLHIGDPGTGASNAAAGSTTRNQITWNAASGGSMTLNTLSAWTNGGATETISHVSLWDDPTAGNFLHSFTLSASQAWVNTNTLTLTTFTLSRSPIAA